MYEAEVQKYRHDASRRPAPTQHQREPTSTWENARRKEVDHLLRRHDDVCRCFEHNHPEADEKRKLCQEDTSLLVLASKSSPKDVRLLPIPALQHLCGEIHLVTLTIETRATRFRLEARMNRRYWSRPKGCHAKVSDLEAARRRNEDVCWFKVKVTNIRAMNESQSLYEW